MARQVIWTEPVLEAFIKEANLTPEEIEIMRTRVEGWSQLKQCSRLGYSLPTLNRKIKVLKVKYDRAQSHSEILPPRVFGVDELFK